MESNSILKDAKASVFRFLLSLCLVSLPAAVSAEGQSPQTKKTFTTEMKGGTVKDVLDFVEHNSDYVFFYGNTGIDTGRTVSLSVKNEPVEVILAQIFKGTDVKYEINGSQISLKKETAGKASGTSQTKRKLMGTVSEASNGEPLPGATVQVKGNNGIWTTTDIDGNYEIEVTDKTELIFSCMGFKTQTLVVGDLGVLNVKMPSDNEVLDEVVVVGAGTQKKVSVTGSITSIKGLDMKAPSATLTNNLAGKLAGLVSSTKSGKPGEGSEFYIRGIGTFGGRATPLILLDGIEITSEALNSIPPESIDQFSILKDASATAIYGSRGANGVLIITTKEGTENTKAKVSANAEVSFLSPMQKMEYVDGARWMEVYNEVLTSRTPTAAPKYSEEAIANTRNGVNPLVYPDVDWYGILFKNFTMNQRMNLNVQGGGSHLTYYMSVQANHDTGLINCPKDYVFDNNYNRWSYIFQNNINYRLTPSTKVNLKLHAQFQNNKGLGNNDNLYYNVYDISPVMFPPILPAQEGDEYIRFGNRVFSGKNVYTNPYAELLRQSKQTNLNDINASLSIDQGLDFITKGLKITALVAMNARSTSTYTSTMAPYYFQVDTDAWNPSDPTGYKAVAVGDAGSTYQTQSAISRWSFMTWYLDARINYARSFGDHNVSALLMYMMREYREQQLPNRNQGLSGRITYDWKNRYLAEVNFGYNGTERLLKKQRFEFFPAVSLGWVVSNEDWWNPVRDVVNHLKVRGSYGLVGSDDTGKNAGAQHFLYVSNVYTYKANFFTGPSGEYSKSNAPVISAYPVEDACWEKAKKLDIGVDINLFNSLSISVDYFHDRREKILMQRGSWPNMLGYNTAKPWGNVGKADNRGFDASLNWTKQLTDDFSMSVRGTLTYIKNKLVYVDEPDYTYTWQATTGWPLVSYRWVGYVADGLFKDQEDIDNSPEQNLGSQVMPGDIKYRDLNGDGKITKEDRTLISDCGTAPRLQYGIGLYLKWKGFDLGVFFNGSGKRTIYQSPMNPFGADTGTEWGAGERQLAKYIDNQRWTEANPDPNAAYPRLGTLYTDVKNNLETSSYWLRDGSFIRFKTLELGYTFPYCRVYFSADNLAVWSPFKLWDPELSWNSFPLQRTFNIGLQFNF